MDIFDFLGITQLLSWTDKKLSDQNNSVQSPLPNTKFSYRPQNFDEFISQEKAKDKIKLTIELINKGFPRHFLLTGGAGLGKTSMANIIANELGFNFVSYVGSSFNIFTMQDFLVKNQDGKFGDKTKPNLLFIDEIAGVDRKTLAYMLPIIEDFKLNGLDLRKFCLVGATTDNYVLINKCSPFVDRIHCHITMEDYSSEDIKNILIQYNDQVHRANISSEVYDILSKNVRFTPRIAISYFDFLVACGSLNKVLKMNRIIMNGLTDLDFKILNHLKLAKGKSVGEETLSIIANISRIEYKTTVEPYLLRQELLSRTSSGRIITDRGLEFLKEVGIENGY